MINEECVSCMCNLVVSLWVAIYKYTFYLTQAVFVIFITAHMHYRYKVKGSMATIFLLKFIFSIFKMCTITLIGNRNLKVIRWFISVVYITKFLFKFTLFFSNLTMSWALCPKVTVIVSKVSGRRTPGVVWVSNEREVTLIFFCSFLIRCQVVAFRTGSVMFRSRIPDSKIFDYFF